MAQADYNIANLSGAAFRTELNETLSAILTLNSGATAPIPTPYQLWADTSTSPAVLKQYNGSAFVTIGTIGSVNLGLAALASPTFTGVPLAPTASAGTNTTQIATTAFVASSFLPLAGGTVTGNVTLNAQSDVRFADADSSNYVALQAPATVAANLTLTLPATTGSSGQALTTDGSGALSFATIAGVPVGAVFYFAASTAPTGYVKANGATVSREGTFAALFAVIGTTYGVGDGSTTFKLPDLRGEFIRGWDDARGIDVSRAFGSAQAADTNLLSHTHSTTVTGFAKAQYGDTGSITYGAGFTQQNNDGDITSNPNTASLTYTTGAASPAGGAETRPRNVALLACIKF